MDGWIQNNYEWEGMGMPISEGIIKFFFVFPILREPFFDFHLLSESNRHGKAV